MTSYHKMYIVEKNIYGKQPYPVARHQLIRSKNVHKKLREQKQQNKIQKLRETRKTAGDQA